jgi:hypothetical protein
MHRTRNAALVNIGRLVGAVVLSLGAALLSGCYSYMPLLSEAMERGWHEHVRGTATSKANIRAQLADLSCLQLGEWEQVALYELNVAPRALSTLSAQVLEEDLSQIRLAMEARRCPSYRELLSAGTPDPVAGTTMHFRCVCWEPIDFSPFVKEGPGPAGPDCVTVRAELSRGTFVFVERSRLSGDWRHEVRDPHRGTVLAALDRGFVGMLLGSPQARRPSTDETDGWVQMWRGPGNFRILTDDCKPLPPDAASVVERTIVRWLTEPADK